MSDLERFMASIRMQETGTFDGDYRAVRFENGVKLIGAYGFREEAWPAIARNAGLEGAPWRDPHAQDIAAAGLFDNFYSRYGNWSLVAAAHVGGTSSADQIARRGFRGVDAINNEDLRKYVSDVTDTAPNAPVPERPTFYTTAPSGQWVNPVAGESNWSPGSYLYQRTASQRQAGKTPIHQGIDVYAAKGTPILSPVAGTIESAGTGTKGGHYVTIVGDDGIRYYFAHMESEAKVGNGDRVSAGQHVGFVGASGNAQGTSPHLHMEMRDAETRQLINPASFLEGAYSAGGTFKGSHHPALVIDEDPHAGHDHDGVGSTMTSFMDSWSNAIAGGERQDYRNFGIESDDQIEGATPETPPESPVERFLAGPR
jgi:murein DD-endopeptidase MepM/ murein hydrolase activator NlpD